MQEVLDFVASIKRARQMLSYDPSHPVHCGPIKICIYGARRTYRSTIAKDIALALSDQPYALVLGIRKQKQYPLPFRTTTKRFFMNPDQGVLLIDDFEHQNPDFRDEALDRKCWAVIIVVCGIDVTLPQYFRPFITPLTLLPLSPSRHIEQTPPPALEETLP